MDDADERGPGECPGHEPVPTVLMPDGLRLARESGCRWCGAVFYDDGRRPVRPPLDVE